MGQCYACDKEVEKKEDDGAKMGGNTYYIKKGFLSANEEVIICSDGSKETGCWYAFDSGFVKGLDDIDWYEMEVRLGGGFKKILTKQGIDFINSKGKSYFKNYAKNKEKEEKEYYDRIEGIAQRIVTLLKEKSKKIAISDIAAFLKEDREEVKSLLEYLHSENKIDFAGNGRYFILSEEKETSKKATAKETESVADEIKKFKELLDAGAITQEEYDAKKKELLGL